MRNFFKEWKFRRAAKRYIEQPRSERLAQLQALTESMTRDELLLWSVFPCGPAMLEAARKDPKSRFYRPEASQ